MEQPAFGFSSLSSLVIVDDLFGRVVPAAVVLDRLGFFDRQIELDPGNV